MALTSTRSQDHPIMGEGENVVPGVPKAGYTPLKGHLVRREAAQSNEWDLCADGEVPGGLLLSTNSDNGTISVAMLVPGVSLILERSGAIAVGQSVVASATSMGTVIARTVVKTVAPGSGVGTVVANDPRGTGTTQVVV